MFYGNLNESFLTEGKILDFIKNIYETKKREEQFSAGKFVDTDIKLLDCNLKIFVHDKYIKDFDKDKNIAICKHDAPIINEAKNEILDKSKKIYESYDKSISKEDIEFSDAIYNIKYNEYDININCSKNKYTDFLVYCIIKIKDNKANISVNKIG